MGLGVEKKRRDRQRFAEQAPPQCGIDTLKGAFSDADDAPLPGVRESGACPDG